jgi:hypothetical protein
VSDSPCSVPQLALYGPRQICSDAEKCSVKLEASHESQHARLKMIKKLSQIIMVASQSSSHSFNNTSDGWHLTLVKPITIRSRYTQLGKFPYIWAVDYRVVGSKALTQPPGYHFVSRKNKSSETMRDFSHAYLFSLLTRLGKFYLFAVNCGAVGFKAASNYKVVSRKYRLRWYEIFLALTAGVLWEAFSGVTTPIYHNNI